MDQSTARGAFVSLAISAAAVAAPLPSLTLGSAPGPEAAYLKPVQAVSAAPAPSVAAYAPPVQITDDVVTARPVPAPRRKPPAQPAATPPAPTPTPYPSYDEPPSPVPQRPSYGSVQGYAESLVGPAQFSCLLPLWNAESGWNPYAENPSSGAYGIPQALPGSKMASAGADWQTDPDTQVRWGIAYIDGTYGSPCGAWAHEQAAGWY